MSARIKIPDNLVGKYVEKRFDATNCNLFEDVKLQIVELIKSSFPKPTESTVRIITRVFENDTIEITHIFHIDGISLIDTLYVTCITDGMCVFELDIQSVNDDVECCNSVMTSISTILESENKTGRNYYSIVYPHNFFY